MKKYVLQLVFSLSLILLTLQGDAAHAFQLYDMTQHRVLEGAMSVNALSRTRIILLGEQHENLRHHEAQLTVIRALNEAGRKPAVAMEMFRSDAQADLDRWVAGEIDESQFKSILQSNWGQSWELYAPILRYVREKHISLVGLNVSASVTGQVANQGFASLNEVQRGQLEGITCDVSQDYRDFILHAYSGHEHGNLNFEWFCEAQLVWDTAMAITANNYASRHPDNTVIILTGIGHARKQGIPAQLKKLGAPDSTVTLPWFEDMDMTLEDADYIFIFDER